MMKKKPHLLFSATSPSSLSTIGTISEIRSFSYIFPSSLSNNQSPPPLRLHRLPLCPPFVTFEKFVVFQIKSPPPCQIISSLPPSAAPSPSLSTIRNIREIRSLSNKVPSPLSNNQSPPPPSPAPSPSPSTIRDIREIRSLSNTLPSFGGVGGGPLHPIECIISVCAHHWCN